MEQIISFKVTGNEFSNKRYNVKYLVDAMDLFQKLLDSSYLSIIGKSKLYDNDRENFRVYAMNLRSGSFEADFIIKVGFIATTIIQNYPSSNPADIWRTAKEAFQFLKVVYENQSKGKNINIEIIDSPGVNVVLNSNDANVKVNSEALETAKKAQGAFKEYSRRIEKVPGVEGFQAWNKNDSADSISFTREEIPIFKNKPIIENEILKIKGIYTQANSNSMTGRIKVIDNMNSPLKEDEYHFKFINNEVNEKKFREGFVQERVYTAKRKLIFNIDKQQLDVVSLHLINILE